MTLSKLKTILKAHKNNIISIKQFNVKDRYIELHSIGKGWNFCLYLEDSIEDIKSHIASYKAHKEFYANLTKD